MTVETRGKSGPAHRLAWIESAATTLLRGRPGFSMGSSAVRIHYAPRPIATNCAVGRPIATNCGALRASTLCYTWTGWTMTREFDVTV